MVEPFTQEQIAGARKQIAAWGHNLDKDPEKLAYDLEATVMNELSGGTRYGAHTSTAKRPVVLMDEYEHGKDFLNCALAGYNTFLLYYAIGLGDQLRLMSMKSDDQAAHASLLRYDKGMDEDPIIIDPMWGLLGRVHIGNKGIIYTPEALLKDRNVETNNPQRRRVLDAKALEGILDAEDVAAEIRRYNSPIGIIDYFGEGQRLIKYSKSTFNNQVPFDDMEIFSKTDGDQLKINVTFGFPLPFYFTSQLVYEILGNKITIAEGKNFLHFGNSWGISDIVLDGQGYHPESMKQDALTAAFVFMVQSMNRGHAPDDVQVDWIRSYKKMRKELGHEITKASIKVDNEGVAQSIFDAKISNQEKYRLLKLGKSVEDHSTLLKMATSLKSEDRGMFFMAMLATEVFQSRLVKAERPYFKLNKEEVKTAADFYEIVKDIFVPIATEHHKSPISKLMYLSWGEAQYKKNLIFG